LKWWIKTIYKDIDLNGIKVNMNDYTLIHAIQVNLNKCRDASINLMQIMKKQKGCQIAFIQEPYNYKGTLALVPQNMTIIPTSRGSNSRAALILSKGLEAKEVRNLNNRDMARALVRLGGRSTLVASLYLDINHDVLTNLENLRESMHIARHGGIARTKPIIVDPGIRQIGSYIMIHYKITLAVYQRN